MEGIDQWAITVTVCAVVVCIAELLISDTALEKTLRLVMGAFMLCAVLIPLGETVSSFSPEGLYPEQPSSFLPEDMASLKEGYMEDKVAGLIEDTLASRDVTPMKITVLMDKDENNSITGLSAEVSLSKADAKKAPEVTKILKDELGIECRTRIAG